MHMQVNHIGSVLNKHHYFINQIIYLDLFLQVILITVLLNVQLIELGIK